MKVREIMTTDVATASPDTTLEEIATMMRDEDTGAIPVVEENELIGVITDRDIVIRCIAEGRKAAEATADDVISENIETVEPDVDVDEAARLMAQKQVRRLPVVENGRLVGMLSLGDIAVKESDETAGEALESVSKGVKRGRGSRTEQHAKVQPRRGQAAQSAAQARHRAALRQDQERGEGRLVTGGRRSPQGISNHDINEERQRQERVVPIRNKGKTVRGRKAS